ncbi:hypothetical protein [Spirillospora sp. NBC_01491]|uniref:hypothetical protein n=1 Tax=Spirillospora sp. NBC_01491 TaxID=2976007 RepID=UPI002E2F20F7|nr:hypothetical protein [Spirillospora sp. NBC_01491]
MTRETTGDAQQNDGPEPGTSEGAAFVITLAVMLRGRKLTSERVGERLVRVTAEAGSRGVEVGCRRRASDGDRWWFTWGDSAVWLCEADNPTEAVLHVKSALRTVGTTP